MRFLSLPFTFFATLVMSPIVPTKKPGIKNFILSSATYSPSYSRYFLVHNSCRTVAPIFMVMYLSNFYIHILFIQCSFAKL